MDPISISRRCRLKIICTKKSSQTPIGGEVGYHDHGAAEAQGSSSPMIDPVDVT